MNSFIPLPEEWREQWARELAEPPAARPFGGIFSALVFRLADEWFSVLSDSIVEISPVPVIHRIPHRPAGIVNVQGRVTVCVDLARHLRPLGTRSGKESRLVVFRHEDWIFAAVVDAIAGVHRVTTAELVPPPPRATSDHFVTDFWTLDGRSVARIDEARLFTTVKEALA